MNDIALKEIAMRELFEALKDEGEVGLQRLINERTQETLMLEFKRKLDPKHGKFDKPDNEKFAELLSGFANSAGGLGIWGIAAERDAIDLIDCAKALVPISNIEQFRSQAHSNSGQLIMPRHEGIEIASINAANPGEGYLLVWVERSERRPHRSEASGVKQYYKRAGDSFFAMEHYDIEDAFHRIVNPSIDLYWEVQRGGDNVTNGGVFTSVYIEFSLINSGEAIVRFPYLRVRPGEGLLAIAVEPHLGQWSIEPSGTVDGFIRFYGGANDVIHPGDRMPVARLVKNVWQVDNLGNLDRREVEGSNLEFSARCGGENVRSVSLDISISGSDFVERMQRLGMLV